MVAPKFNFRIGLGVGDELAQRIRRHCGCDAEHERDAQTTSATGAKLLMGSYSTFL